MTPQDEDTFVMSKKSINKSIKKMREIIIIANNFFENASEKFPKEWKILEKLFNKIKINFSRSSN